MNHKILYSNTGKEILVDEEDYEKLSNLNWNDYGGYARTFKRTKGKLYSLLMHRLILNIENSKIHVDHINGNTLDNRKNNLRLATVQQNGFNRKLNKNSSTKYKGVVWHKRDEKYQAQIKINGKKTYLGYFNSPIEAAKAYDKAAVQYYGEFAKLNFPKDK